MTRSEGEKAKCQSGKNKERKPDQRGKANGIMLKGREAFKEDPHDQHLLFVLLGLNSTYEINQYK